MTSSSRPLVSVILPTYNRAYILKRAVDSVLAQTYDHLELIVVDDGSTDNTQELLKSYKDPRLKALTPGKNGGPAAARNRGLVAAQGEYIAFQDSDDEWLLEKLEKQVAHLQANPTASLSIAGYISINVHGEAPNYCEPAMWRRSFLAKLFKFGARAPTPTWMARKASLDRTDYFDEAMPCFEDWELSMRLDAAGGIVELDELLNLAFDTRGSVKMTVNAFARVMEHMMHKHPTWMTDQKRIQAQCLWMMGNWERESGRIQLARKYFMRSIKADPTFLRPWLTMVRRAPDLFRSPKSTPA